MTSLFEAGDALSLSFDEHRRLRVKAPQESFALAAWLYADAQPNLAALDRLGQLLEQCRHEQATLVGNSCLIDFVNNVVVLESRYELWPRTVLPQTDFWTLLNGFRGYLAGTADQPRLARPADYPIALRQVVRHVPENSSKQYLVDQTYFPPSWSPEEVAAAGDGAWTSPQVVRDEQTGVWSGMWGALEIAGCYDADTGEVLTYFPVLSP
ncbi:EndoU domain-containing protein [Amycolatopsis jejuensis]|uniref:EndoU domain-containing protein n=1 Tax=Amycolatopsis jejuensis TaxID=330084 RepID=UPI0005274BA4|nr:EndoU domain-containing protein [Amycolatopsis jejuensis]